MHDGLSFTAYQLRYPSLVVALGSSKVGGVYIFILQVLVKTISVLTAGLTYASPDCGNLHVTEPISCGIPLGAGRGVNVTVTSK